MSIKSLLVPVLVFLTTVIAGESSAQIQAVDLFRAGARDLAGGNLDKAIQSYEKGVQLKPDAKEGWYNLGVAYGRKRSFAKEVEAYKKAIEIDPNYSNALHNLGLAYLDMGNKEKAVETLDSVVKVDPGATDAWNNLGIARMEMGDLDLAVSAFSKAIETAPTSIETRFNLLISLIRQAEVAPSTVEGEPVYRQALEHCELILKDDPKYYRALYNKGVILHRLNNGPGEIAAYRLAIEVKSDFAPALYNLAAALSAKGDIEEAITAWQAFLDAARKHPGERSYVDNATKEIERLKALPK